MRPATLPASAAPVLVGTALAWQAGGFSAIPAAVALLGALLTQIGTNFANDLFDFEKGADTQARLGPVRAAAAGLLTSRQLRGGMIVAFGLAFLTAVYLTEEGQEGKNAFLEKRKPNFKKFRRLP